MVNFLNSLDDFDSGPDDQSNVDSPSVVVAVLTYCRTESLADTVDALLNECARIEGAGVLVVDNNPGRDAEPTVLALAARSAPGAVQYDHEPMAGIAAARNRAMRHAAGARLLVFIDDDETPAAGWLAFLVALHTSRAPAAIAGPVISEFSTTPEPWIEAGHFFVRRRMATGSKVRVAATNNLLLDVAQVQDLSLEFDVRFGMTGGEDTLFTRQLVRRGGTILWCDEAVVFDKVPPSRINRQWVLRKAFSMGNSRTRVDMALASTRLARDAVRIRDGLGGIVRIATGLLRAGLGVVRRDLRHRAMGARMAARGAGMCLGAVGYMHVQYARSSSGTAPRRHGAVVPRNG